MGAILLSIMGICIGLFIHDTNPELAILAFIISGWPLGYAWAMFIEDSNKAR